MRVRNVLLALVPPNRREWVRAALAEASALPAGPERAAWTRSALWFLVWEALLRRVLLVVATAAAFALIVVLDRSPSDDAGQVTLAVILLTSAALGAAAGRRAWAVGTVIGSAVALNHLASLALSIPEPGVELPPGWASTTSLFVLVIPALVAAYAGAWIRSQLSSGESRPPA